MPLPDALRHVVERHRAAIWKGVGVGGFLLLCIAGVTAYHFGTVDEQVYFPSGRFLDCGTALSPSHSALAEGICGDATRGDLLGLVLMLLAVVGAVGLMVLATLRERSRRR